jgi:hypothetical protein
LSRRSLKIIGQKCPSGDDLMLSSLLKELVLADAVTFCDHSHKFPYVILAKPEWEDGTRHAYDCLSLPV